MDAAWGVMCRRAAFALTAGFVCLGCHRHVPVGTARLDEPGLQVAATPNSTSVVWPNGRVCTMSANGNAARRGTYGPPPGPPSGGHGGAGTLADVFFFRLCEARANGDLTEAQYHAILERLLSTLQRQGERVPGAATRRAQPWSRPHRDPKVWHGEDAAGLSGPARDPVAPPGVPTEPGWPPPQPQPPPAPVQPVTPTPPVAPSTGVLPDTRR